MNAMQIGGYTLHFQTLLQCGGLLVLAILFLQSGLDKITDFKGNMEWLKGHFSKSPLSSLTPFMVVTITLLEVVTGLSSLAGIGMILFAANLFVAKLAALLALLSLTCLFFGQRMAKDYSGAASLMGYLAFTLLVLFSLM